MKEISDNNILLQISGAGDSNNSAIAGSFGKDVAWGIGTGLITGGPGGAVIGAGVAATQNVLQGAINHGPVNVPIPTVPMGPTWNGSHPYGPNGPSAFYICKMTGGISCSQ